MPLPGQYSSGTLPKTPMYVGDNERLFREAASQTFQAEELVSLDSSGNVINMGTLADPSAASVSAALVAGDFILGMAKNAASNLSAISPTKNIAVVVADDTFKFFCRVYNSTATSAELQDVALGDLASFKRYNGAGDIQTVITDAADGTDAVNKGVVLEKPNDLSDTDQYPGVWVGIRSAYRALGR